MASEKYTILKPKATQLFPKKTIKEALIVLDLSIKVVVPLLLMRNNVRSL